MNLRHLAITLLDDQHGINEKAYNILAQGLREAGHDDILNLVDAGDGYFFLPENHGLLMN